MGRVSGMTPQMPRGAPPYRPWVTLPMLWGNFLRLAYILPTVSVVSFPGLTGEGVATIATDWVPIYEVDATLVTPGPKTRLIGSTWPRAVRYAGHVGLAAVSGVFTGDPFTSVAGPEFVMQNESQAFYIPNSQAGAVYFTSIFWRLAPGVVVDVQVWWGF